MEKDILNINWHMFDFDVHTTEICVDDAWLSSYGTLELIVYLQVPNVRLVSPITISSILSHHHHCWLFLNFLPLVQWWHEEDSGKDGIRIVHVPLIDEILMHWTMAKIVGSIDIEIISMSIHLMGNVLVHKHLRQSTGIVRWKKRPPERMRYNCSWGDFPSERHENVVDDFSEHDGSGR